MIPITEQVTFPATGTSLPLHARSEQSAAAFTRSRLPTTRRRRTFIAFLFEALAILASICFHGDSNASTEEVHMKIHSTNRQKPMLCATAAAGMRTLLG